MLRTDRRQVLTVLVLFTSLGACVAQPDASDPDPARVQVIFAVECPGGTTRETNPGVCVGSLGGPDEVLSEANVAGHPTRKDVWALGVNSVSARPRDLSVNPASPTPGAATGFYVTQNDGERWTPIGLPILPNHVHFGDPSLAFDDQGRLHFSELARDIQNERLVVHYARSSDLGRSWDVSRILDDGEGQDRNWLSVGPSGTVFITWQKGGGPPDAFTQVAWSLDAGQTWQDLGPEGRIPSCNLQTEVVVGTLGPVVACVKQEGENRYATHVSLVDLEHRTTTLLTRLPSPTGTLQLDRLADGTLALSMPSYPANMQVFHSRDGGQTWGDPVVVRDLVTAEDAWTWSWLSFTAPDPHGAVHLLLVGGTGENCYRGTCEDDNVNHEVLHVSLDPVRGELLRETLLTPADAAERGRDEPRALPGIGDEFHGIAFGAAGGMLVWGHQQSLDFTRLAPSPRFG